MAVTLLSWARTHGSCSHLPKLNADASNVEWCQRLEGQCLQVDLLRAALVTIVVQHHGQSLLWVVTHLQGKETIGNGGEWGGVYGMKGKGGKPSSRVGC